MSDELYDMLNELNEKFEVDIDSPDITEHDKKIKDKIATKRSMLK